MNDPIYEIPLTPEPVDGWHPGRPGRTGPDAAAPSASRAPDAAAPAAPGLPEAALPAAPAADAFPTRRSSLSFEALLAGEAQAPSTGAASAGRGASDAEAPSAGQGLTSHELTGQGSTGLDETAAYPRDLLGSMAAPAPAPAPAPTPEPVMSFGAPASAHAAPTLAAPTRTAPSVAAIELDEHARLHADRELIEALIQVVRQRASDLHVTVGAVPMLRVDGSLRPALEGAPWDREKVAAALNSLLSPEQAERFDEQLELDFAYGLSAQSRFRVNYYQQRGSLGAAFRLIPTEIKQLGDLGVPDTVGRFAGLPRGLVLVTGPTGSGKSTTLAALIDLVNSTRADHIVTVEDPIEFMHKHKKAIVNQREVGADTHSFANALKHVLRQDPDVILIGELRDLETISVALTAAETGHLVFATLHTQDAPQSIDRIIDVFPPHQQDQVRTQLAGTLQGVVSQTLVPKASGSGRVVATEILMMTPAIGNLIREGKTYQIASAMQAGRELGMHTMDQHLADLVNNGTITHKAAMEKVHDPEGFDRLVQRVESPTAASARALAGAGIDFGDAYSRTVS